MTGSRKNRQLGDARAAVLYALAANGGTWHPGGKGLGGNSVHWTIQILRSLAQRGLVVELTGKPDSFKLTDEGNTKADEAPMITPPW